MNFNQLKLGAILSYASLFVTVVISLVYTPITIRLLGQSEYGLYAMIGSISAYLSIMDLGLGNAIVRYTARNRGTGNFDEQPKLNGLFFVLYSIIGILTIVIGFFIYNSIDLIFGGSLDPTELKKVKLMVIIIVFNFAISLPLAIFGAYMEAYEKFVIIKIITIIRTIIIPAITIPFLFSNHGSVTMVLISSIVNVMCLFFNVFYCIRNLNIKFKFFKIDLALLKEILTYSFFIFLGIIVDQIYWNTGQIVLGILSGTAAVAIFSIAIQIVRIYLQFSTALSSLFLPRISIMVAKDADHNELTNVMIRFGRIQFIVLSFILSGFIIFGKKFIEVWAGNEYITAYNMVLLIMVPITIPLIQNIGLAILQAKNFQKFRSVMLIIIAILNLVISVSLAERYNGFGVAFSTGLAYILGNSIVMNIYYYKKLKINIPLFWRNILKLTIPLLFSMLVGFIVSLCTLNGGLIIYLFGIIIYSIVFFIVFWKKGFNEEEKKLLKNVIRRIFKLE